MHLAKSRFQLNLKVQSLMRYRTSLKSDWEMIFHEFKEFCFPCINQCKLTCVDAYISEVQKQAQRWDG